MKKILVLALVFIAALSMIGCDKDGTGTAGSSQNGGGQQTTDGGAVSPTQTATGNPKMDLNVEKVTWSTINPEIGSTVDLKITVVNVGTEAVESFDYNVKILKDGASWKDETKAYGNTLYPGNKTKIELQYTLGTEGKYKAEIYVDRDNKLEEKNRFNNVGFSLEANAMKATSTPSGTDDEEEEEDDSDSSSSSSSSSSSNCVDTDSGVDEFTKGECDDGVTTFGISDYCKSSSVLVEFKCSDDRCLKEEISCADGCENGVCI